MHGRGYSPDFVMNVMHTVESLSEGPGLVVSGPDDICDTCPITVRGIQCAVDEHNEEGIRRLDEIALSLLELRPGDPIDVDRIRAQLPDIIVEWRRTACANCKWLPECMPALDLVEQMAL
jgi:hypothetical protein